ncbi:winged helix DNA-binding domain-containing protein [Candidatus Bipolaricaulota bacterium]|nr:winged helix DNA-binding domain-containing protein [Candidatus Bipolaricaulota bacterium]
MTTTQSISVKQARRIVLRAQLLDGRDPSIVGKKAVAATIEHLGYVQIDTIAVVERSHHHTLWTRCPDYDAASLHDLQAVDKRVFEYWAHAMAFLPMADYRFYLPRMERHRESGPAWLERWKSDHGHLCADILARIRAEGALSSVDFEPPPGTKRGTWWDWKPAKRALEILFWQGHLMIAERRNFQKVYDLTERVLPPDTETTRPSEEEMGRFHVRRALGGLGIAREREIRDAFHIADRPLIVKTLEEMVDEGEPVALSIDGLRDTYYAMPGELEAAAPGVPDSARILSPFDNLVIQRDRIARLFGFDYTIECYLPETKRTFGYFVLPVLWRDQLVGRLDPKADRKERRFLVKALWFEPGFDGIDAALPAFADALARLARFNGCDAVELDRIDPTGHKRRLKTLVRQALVAQQEQG